MVNRQFGSRAEKRTYFNQRNLAKVVGGLSLALCVLGIIDTQFSETAKHATTSVETTLSRIVMPSSARQPAGQAVNPAPRQRLVAATEATAPRREPKQGRWRAAVQQIRKAANGPVGLAGAGLALAYGALVGVGSAAGRTQRETAVYAEDDPDFWRTDWEIAERNHAEHMAAVLEDMERRLDALDGAVNYSTADATLANMEARHRSPLNAVHGQVLSQLYMDPQRALTYHA